MWGLLFSMCMLFFALGYGLHYMQTTTNRATELKWAWDEGWNARGEADSHDMLKWSEVHKLGGDGV